MTCARFDEVLRADASVEALAHAKGCPECGPARAAWDAIGRTPPRSLEKARAAAAAELAAHPKSSPWWREALLLCGVNLAVAGAAVSVFKWNEAQHDSPAMRWGVVAGLVVVMVAGAWAAIRPGVHGLRWGLLGLAALVAVWAGLGGSGAGGGGPFSGGAACAEAEAMVIGVPMLVVLWVSSRFAFDPARALLGGASVGATGMLALHLHCPNGTAAHVIVFHVLPWLVFALTTLGVRRMLPSRSYAP